MRVKMRHGPAPSMRAASSSSDPERESRRRLRDDEPLVRAQPAEALGQDVLRHQHDGVGNHQAADEEHEDEVAAGKAHARERVCRHGGREENQGDRAERHDGAVEERAADPGGPRAAEQDLDIVRERRRPWDPLRRKPDDVLGELEGGDKDPERRQQPENGAGDHDRGQQPAAATHRISTGCGRGAVGTGGGRRRESPRRAPTPWPRPSRTGRSSGTRSRRDAGRRSAWRRPDRPA